MDLVGSGNSVELKFIGNSSSHRGSVYADNGNTIGFLKAGTGAWAARWHSDGKQTSHGHIWPNANNTYNLGDGSYRWGRAYLSELCLNTSSSNSILTINSGSAANAVSIRNTTGGNGHVGILFSTQDHSGGREKAAIYHQDTHGTAHYGGDFVFCLNTATGSAGQVSISDRKARLTRHGDWMVGTDNNGNGSNANEPVGTVMKSDGQIICRRNDLMFTAKSIATGGYTAFRTMSAQTEVGNITFNSGGTSYNTSSDYRRKENIVSITDGIAKVKQLKPYRFNFKTADSSQVVQGFFAHEVSSVVPNAVNGDKDGVAAEDNNDTGHKKGDPIYQGLDTAKMVPILTAALKEAIDKIETLETKVATLESA